MLPISILLSFFAIFFGLIFGSFLNVITYRLPNNQSIVSPRSFCPNCKKTIPWFENIPIFSWIRLKGKCSNCKQLISIKYPLTEVLTGILFLLSFNAIRQGLSLGFLMLSFSFYIKRKTSVLLCYCLAVAWRLAWIGRLLFRKIKKN